MNPSLGTRFTRTLSLATWIGTAAIYGSALNAQGREKQRSPEQQARADSTRRAERSAKANRLALFATDDVLEFTLVANFADIARDRDTLSTKRFAAVLTVKDTAGEDRHIPVRLRTRGHFRLSSRNCRFVPLRIDFPDSLRKGTPFAGQDNIKLGTHCQANDRYETYTRREYLAYRIFNQLTDKSLRARLARATYVDSATQKVVDTRTALFIEDEDDVAKRMGARIQEIRRALFADVHRPTLLTVTIFEYLIGNTDWSLSALHNMRLAQTSDFTYHPLAYDFDFSGLVDAHYASVSPLIGTKSVRERVYRGPCLTPEESTAMAARFFAAREAVMAQVRAVPGFTERDIKQSTEYLDEFFKLAQDPSRFKRVFVDNCEDRVGA